MDSNDIRNRFRVPRGSDHRVPARQPRPAAPPPPGPSLEFTPLPAKPAAPKPQAVFVPPVPAQPKPQPTDWPKKLNGKPTNAEHIDLHPETDRPFLPDMPADPKKKDYKQKPKSRKGWLLAPLVLLLLAGVGAGGYFGYTKYMQKPPADTAQTQNSNQAPATAPTEQASTLRIMGVGNTIAFTSVNNSAKQADGSYNYLPMMQAMKPIFDKADVRFCSQATPSAGAGLGVSGTPVFNAPTELAKGLSGVGCNVIGLASDHINDKDQAGIDATLAGWSSLGPLAVAGVNSSAEQQNKPQVFTVKGTKLALLSYTTASAKAPGTPFGVNLYSEQLVKAHVDQIRKEAQFIIVSMHWGVDGQSEQNPEQDKIAQYLASLNVDIVFGHGPHAVQPVKVLNGEGNHQTLVWFSLGNFLNSMIPTESLIGGVAVMDVNPSNGQILNPRFMPTYMHYEWTAQQKQRQSADDVLARSNLQIVPLDKATDLLAKSQANTTVKAQQDRLNGILNKHLKVPVISSTDL